MPTTYAHWRFGNVSLNSLDEKYKIIINKYRSLFDIGVHGPDIFFYYNALKHNDINMYGSRMHDTSMKQLLEGFRKVYREAENREASLSYLLGFLAHFTLDSYCHSYIEKKTETEGPSHNKIESQFDRYLMILDRRDPIKTKPAFSLKPDQFTTSIIAPFFPELTPEQVMKTTKDQVFYLNLLKDTSDLKRFILTTGMKLLKVNSFLDLLTTKKEDPGCRTSNIRLLKYFNKAVEHYPILAENMISYLEEGTQLLPFFDYNFAYHDGYKDIPLLTLQQEETYSAEFI